MGAFRSCIAVVPLLLSIGVFQGCDMSFGGLRGASSKSLPRCDTVTISSLRIYGNPINLVGQDDGDYSDVDPYFKFYVGDKSVGSTGWKRNKAAGIWGEASIPNNGADVTIVCLDRDNDADDYIGHYTLKAPVITSQPLTIRVHDFGYNTRNDLPTTIQKELDMEKAYGGTSLAITYTCK